eukprot:320471_1
MVLSIIISSIGGLVTLSAFAHNKFSGEIDSASYSVPLLIALGICDFITDINLSVQMFKHKSTQMSIYNITFLLAVMSVVFIVLPFGSNIYYAMTITNQPAIQSNKHTETWFTTHLSPFILLCLVCGGTYPVILLSSSCLFGLAIFDAGLMSFDLYELSKIKIRSTVFMENVPQLCLQVLYSFITSDLENATVLSFVASSLSVIASVVVYKARKVQNVKVEITKYWLEFVDVSINNIARPNQSQSIHPDERKSIKRNKGLRVDLVTDLCQEFGIARKSLEIETGHAQFTKTKRPEAYTENIYKEHSARVNKIFRKHYKIQNPHFEVRYRATESDIDAPADRNVIKTPDEPKVMNRKIAQRINCTEQTQDIQLMQMDTSTSLNEPQGDIADVLNEFQIKMQRQTQEAIQQLLQKQSDTFQHMVQNLSKPHARVNTMDVKDEFVEMKEEGDRNTDAYDEDSVMVIN